MQYTKYCRVKSPCLAKKSLAVGHISNFQTRPRPYFAAGEVFVLSGHVPGGEFLSGCPERNQRGTRGQAQMSAPRSYSPVPIPSGLRPSPLDKGSRPLDPRFTGAPTRRADLLLQRRGWLSRLTLPRLSLPLTGRERKFGTPLFESAFVAVGLKLCGLEMPGGPVCRPYGICRSAPSFRRGRTLAGPPY